MTGPEHYQEAEQMLAVAEGYGIPDEKGRDLAALAQVHATLASAAATALSAYGTTRPADYRAWVKACGELEGAATAAREGKGQ